MIALGQSGFDDVLQGIVSECDRKIWKTLDDLPNGRTKWRMNGHRQLYQQHIQTQSLFLQQLRRCKKVFKQNKMESQK
jgi:hypothetical protein